MTVRVMSVVPSWYWPPELIRNSSPGVDRPVGLAGDAIVHDRAVRPRAGDGRERHVPQQVGLAAEGFERLHRADFGQLAARRLTVEPREETHHRRAVAPVRFTRAFDLDRVLHRLEQRDRIGPLRDLPAGAGHDPRQRVGGGRLIEADGLAGLAERGERIGEVAGRAHVGELFKPVAHVVSELAAIDEQRRAALARDHRK